ncbi:MAG TPA: gliding motility-associated ABC transporter substrate-binding protein GldG [Bacteroidales bacterium]|nr:gliding motility-associated ABC transporter substrate-binding protein GldG [Bacteroidales bacterium]HRW84420.1 gliding motility-associated ABC transporter substrate-binding protein GldG [Bacteroidales bacterium]
MEKKRMMEVIGKGHRANLRTRSWTGFILVSVIIVLAAVVSGLLRIRLDLTEDKRYTLSEPTREILKGISDDVYIQVFLDGEMPVPLKRLKRSVRDMLEEFRVASGRHIGYEFINPAEAPDASTRQAQYEDLIRKGLAPVNIMSGDDEGGSSRKMIFPGMIINYNGIEMPLDFLRNNQSVSYEQNIQHSVEGLEYELIQTIATITSDTIYRVAFIEGHGEYDELYVADITRSLAKYFTIDRGKIGGRLGIADHYAAVIIAGPEDEFNEADKLVIDQYIMKGGKVLWLLEEVDVNSDSLVFGETMGLYRPLNLEDQLFRYGARINPEVVQDLECMVIPLTVLTGPEKKQIVPVPWLYYPRLIPSSGHPLTRNLNRVAGKFVNTIDTVGLDPAIRKTVLLSTSGYSRTIGPPMYISLKEADIIPDEKTFTQQNLPVAILLEGIFPSAFRNRMTESIVSDSDFVFQEQSIPTKMIVIADGEIIKNEVNMSGNSPGFYPLGKDRYTEEILGNKDFLVNCVNYLVDNNGLMELRSREVKMRLLDRNKLRASAGLWQTINVAGPVVIVILSGLLYGYFRRKKYAGNG